MILFYGNYGRFLIMGSAGFLSSTVVGFRALEKPYPGYQAFRDRYGGYQFRHARMGLRNPSLSSCVMEVLSQIIFLNPKP